MSSELNLLMPLIAIQIIIRQCTDYKDDQKMHQV